MITQEELNDYIDELNKLPRQVECKECGKMYNSLTWKHLKHHGLSVVEYKDKHPGALTSAPYGIQKGKITELNMVMKYGFDEGSKRWDAYKEKQANSNSFEYKREKYGWTREQYDEYNKRRGSSGKSNGNYGKGYLHFWKEKYGEEIAEEMNKRSALLKTHNLENFIKRNGGDVEKANDDYIEYLTSRNSNLYYSEISQSLFRDIFEKYKKNVFFAELNNEWFVRCGSQFYFVDFYDKTTGKVIEFNGDFYHANPSLYEADDELNYPGVDGTIKASELWEKDEKRLANINKNEYIKDILIVWESDFNEDRKGTVNKCLEFLNG